MTQTSCMLEFFSGIPLSKTLDEDVANSVAIQSVVDLGKCLAFVPSPDSLHLSFHFYIIVLLHFLIYTNTPPQDGLKISNMPILLQLNSFSLGPKPFVKQSAS